MRIPLTFSILSLTVFMLLLTSLAHADFTDGVAAYVRGDYTTALKEWRPLAEQGDASAQVTMGLLYDNGQRVPQDYVQAHMWANLAAVQDRIYARWRDDLAASMTHEQIVEAQRLAREWMAQHQK